jgi:hypothetical protein
MPARLSTRNCGRPAHQAPLNECAPARWRGARVYAERLSLEPRDAGGILDLALDGLVARCGPSLGLVLLVWLPFGQIRAILESAGLGDFAAGITALSVNFLTLVPQAFSLGVVTSLVGDALAGGQSGVGRSILRGLWAGPAVTVMLLATQVLTLPLILCFFLPYVLVQWLTWAAVPLYVLEGEELLTLRERVAGRRNPLVAVAMVPRRIARAFRAERAPVDRLGEPRRWTVLAIVGLLLLSGSLELSATLLSAPQVREFLRTDLGLGGGLAELAMATVSGFFLALASSVRAALMTAYYLTCACAARGSTSSCRCASSPSARRPERDAGRRRARALRAPPRPLAGRVPARAQPARGAARPSPGARLRARDADRRRPALDARDPPRRGGRPARAAARACARRVARHARGRGTGAGRRSGGAHRGAPRASARRARER